MTAAQSLTPDWLTEVTMEQLESDPHQVYERLRREAPVAYVPQLGLHIVSTRDLCLEIA